MAVLETNEYVLKAVLTRKGKDIIQRNNERFIISKFALSDDEVNYDAIKDSDPDGVAIESLAVFDPSTNETNVLKNKLIRNADNLEIIAAANQYKQIPQTELSITTQVAGNTTFSLNNWNSDSCTINFSIYSPSNKNYFLSNGFIIDCSEFWTKYGISFDFIPIAPQAAVGETNKYWYNTTDQYKDAQGNVQTVIIGIDNAHKPITGSNLADFVNSLSIPLLSFKLVLNETQLRSIFTTLLGSQTTFLTGNINITNNDQSVTPVTSFYGPTKSYASITTVVPLQITF